MLQTIFTIFSVSVILAIIVLLAVKSGLQLQYLRIAHRQKPGKISDFFRFDFSNNRERKLRWEAFLLFPFFYGIVADDKNPDQNELKLKVKRIHLGIYLCLIILVVLGVYSEKVYP